MNQRHELEKLDQQWVENSECHQSAARWETRGLIGWVAMMAGFGFVLLGLWLNELGEDVRLERLLHPWPIVSVVLGVCVVLGSLVFMVRNGRHIGAYNDAKMRYESRREELLQDLHANESD